MLIYIRIYMGNILCYTLERNLKNSISDFAHFMPNNGFQISAIDYDLEVEL